jgi:peroxiredoxin Q/BCP
MALLAVGQPAPDFSAIDQNGNVVRLKDFRGTKVILYFYPKDDTPGCTKQACGFRDRYAELKQDGYEVLGVSIDSQESHKRFAEKFTLPFRLLVDEDKKIVGAYGAWVSNWVLGRTVMGTKRITYIINEEGIIDRVFSAVNPARNAEEILGAVPAPS